MVLVQAITDLLQPAVESMGYVWWGMEYHPNATPAVLRIYIDRPEGNISIDDIVAVTDYLNPLLDVENPIQSNYTFEVSSPGIDRPLFRLAQYDRYIGEVIKCQLRVAQGGRRRFQGRLLAVDRQMEKVTLICNDARQEEQITLDFSQIEKARIVPTF